MTEPASLVTGVDFVNVPTTDLDAARAFYADVRSTPASATWPSSPIRTATR